MTDHLIESAIGDMNGANDKTPGSAALVVVTDAEVFPTRYYKIGNSERESSVSLTDVHHGGRWISGKQCRRGQDGAWEVVDDLRRMVNLDHVVTAFVSRRSTPGQ